MSIRVMSLVWNSNLSGVEKSVLLAMADYASDSGDSIFPSIATLAKKSSWSERSVQRAINNLIEQECLELVKEGGGRSSTNLYRIRVDTLEKGDSQVKGVRESVKGVSQSQKGVTQSPEPSLTISETSDAILYEECDDDGNPKPPPKPKKEKVVPTPDLFQMADALSFVTGKSLAINRKQIFAEAKELLKDERVTRELILRDYSPGGAWYKNDWRGKQGQRPRLYDIRETLFTLGAVEDTNVVRGGLKDRPATVKGGLK